MSAEDVAKWRKAIAELHRQQRQRRGRWQDASRRIRPGMIRKPADGGDGSEGHHGGDGPWHD